MTFRIHRGASQELSDSVDWYNGRQPGVGIRFLAEFDRVVDLIIADPLRFACAESYRGHREIRRALLTDYPFAVIFEVRDDGILILAVAHASRRQNYWAERK